MKIPVHQTFRSKWSFPVKAFMIQIWSHLSHRYKKNTYEFIELISELEDGGKKPTSVSETW